MPDDLGEKALSPALGRQVLSDIGDLNEGFLDILLRIHARRSADTRDVLALPVAQADRVALLTPAARGRLTHCAFALFDLRLGDAVFWTTLAASGAPGCYRDQRPIEPVQQRQVELFALGALMHLRHLATVNRFIAGLSFATSDAVMDAIGELSLMQLQATVADHPALLECRLGARPDAWDVLVRLARRTDGQPLLPARILGFQHTSPDPVSAPRPVRK